LIFLKSSSLNNLVLCIIGGRTQWLS